MSTPVSSSPTSTEVVDRVLGHAKGDCVVIVEESVQAELRFANNTATTNGDRHSRQVTVVSFDHRRDGVAVGVAAQSGFYDLSALVDRAEHESQSAPVADDAFALVGAEANDSDFDQAPATTEMSVLGSILGALPEAFGNARATNVVLSGFAKHDVTTTYLGSTTGLRRRFVEPDGTMELVARSADGSRSAWASVGTNDFSDVSFDRLHARLQQRLSWSTKKIDLEPGRYEVILPGDAVADLMIPLDMATSGRDARDGQSVFSSPTGTRVGETICSLPLTLASDPNWHGLTTAPFMVAHASSSDTSVFDNGAPVEATEWISGGRLSHLRYHRAGAERSGEAFCPPAENLILSTPNPAGSLEDLIEKSEHALLLTCLWYIREVDPATLLLTGLTRDGVYLVSKGQVVGAVNNFRFNESPVDLLGRVSEAGHSERALSREWNEWMSKTAMAPLRVSGFNMSSVSPAN